MRPVFAVPVKEGARASASSQPPGKGGAGLWNDEILEPFGNRLRCTVKVVNYARDLVAGLWCDLDPELFGLGLQPLIVKRTTKRLAQDLQTVIRNPGGAT